MERSAEVVERDGVANTTAADCGSEQWAVAASTGQRPRRRAEAADVGLGEARPAGTEREAGPGRGRHRRRDGRFLVATQQHKGGDGRSRGLGRAVIGAGGVRPRRGHLFSHPHGDAERMGARRHRPLISLETQQWRRHARAGGWTPQHPAMEAETSAQHDRCHGSDKAEGSSVTNGGIATKQQKFQQRFSNFLQGDRERKKKYSNTESFSKMQRRMNIMQINVMSNMMSNHDRWKSLYKYRSISNNLTTKNVSKNKAFEKCQSDGMWY